jgi:hypothetical protein
MNILITLVGACRLSKAEILSTASVRETPTDFIKSSSHLPQRNSHLRFLSGAMDLNNKVRNILIGGNLTLALLI